jgi:hypothetical protein
MILSWSQCQSSDGQYHVVTFVRIRDWHQPIVSIPKAVFDGIFETLLKLTQDDSATMIGVPGKKSDQSLTFFNTLLQAAKKRVFERHQSSVEIWMMGLKKESSDTFTSYLNLPPWLQITEQPSQGEIQIWDLPKLQSGVSKDTLKQGPKVQTNGSLFFGLRGCDPVTIGMGSTQKVGFIRIADTLLKQKQFLRNPLTELQLVNWDHL